MARRLIGLDVGTNAVTVAEVTPGSPPTLRAFGQVALPREAMDEGEVLDDAAVADAVGRLRAEVGLRRLPVRLGIASPRVIVRQVEMPLMSREDLQGALRFQAQELIPIPIEDAVLDFAILESDQGADAVGAEPTMRVLLAAAQQATVLRLVNAVERGGLPVEAVDLVPLALVRALARPTVDDDGAEGIVSFGGGVTCVSVHEHGAPRFVRVLGTGGRELTEAVATELDLPFEAAESLKRQIGTSDDDVVGRARSAIERPLGFLLDEVRSSIDYYRNQPGAARLVRVVLTGGASLLPGMADRLATLVGLPVERARPRELLGVADIGFSDEDLPSLDPYLPAAVGLALGGAGRGIVIDLMPKVTRRRTAVPSRALAGGAAAAVALMALLAVPTIARQNDLDAAKRDLEEVRAQNDEIQAQIDALADAQQKQAQLDVLRAQLTSLLSTDVSWARMLQEISMTIPGDVWLTSFQGQVTVQGGGAVGDATDSPGPLSAISGTVNFSATGLDYPSVAAWIQRMSTMRSFTQLWVPQASVSSFGTRDVVNFSSTVQVTDAARSDRLDDVTEGDES